MITSSKTPTAEWKVLSVFVLLNLLAKGAFLGINEGEYTDGILQLTSLETKAGLYPPFYETCSRFVAASGLSLEMAGRVVSLIAAALCVLPVYRLGRILGGGRSAAIFAGILYTVSPMPWRWSVRVMTDSTYLLLSSCSLLFMGEAWAQVRQGIGHPAIKKSERLPGAPRVTSTVGLIGMGVGYTYLAVQTRYQGALLAPLFLIILVVFYRRYKQIPWIPVIMAVCFGLSTYLMTRASNFAHAGQFTSRVAASPTATLMAWWNTLESFILISPYYMGYPIAAAALLGAAVVRKTAQPWHARPVAVLWGAYAIMLLGLHAAFGSFQYRYMMPLLPLVIALAGVGFAWAEQWSMRLHPASAASSIASARPIRPRRLLFRAAVIVSLCYLALFSLAILTLQRGTFGDQREAADYIRKNVSATTPVYANERYGNFTKLGSVKLSYWSGRTVQILLSPDQKMEPGAVLALGTAYGGDEAVAALMAALETRYELQPLTPQPFRSEIVPIMDDIMTNPLYNQNPLAWVLRYVPQRFATQLFVVTPRTGAPASGA